MLDAWAQDVRYASRLVRRQPLFATAALSLAIGIGANTTIFTIANALLFKPPAGVTDAGGLAHRDLRFLISDLRFCGIPQSNLNSEL